MAMEIDEEERRKRAAEATSSEDDKLQRILEMAAQRGSHLSLEALMPRIEATAKAVAEATCNGRALQRMGGPVDSSSLGQTGVFMCPV